MTAAGETYGLYHHFEPMQTHSDGTGVDGNDHKYTGTYVLAEQSLKAKGTFQARKGKEMLPFSKFEIVVNSMEENEPRIRYKEFHCMIACTHILKDVLMLLK